MSTQKKNSKQTKKTYSDFIPVCFWRKSPYSRLENLKKGDTVFVEGRISIRSFTSNEKKQWVTEIIGNRVNVFKTKEKMSDMSDLLDLIKSNEDLLEEIKHSDDVVLSESLLSELVH